MNEGVITNLSIQLIPLAFVSTHEQEERQLSSSVTKAEDDADEGASVGGMSVNLEKDHLFVSQSVSPASVSCPDPHFLSMSPHTASAFVPKITNNNSPCSHVFKFNFVSLICLLALLIQIPPFAFQALNQNSLFVYSF